MKEKILMVLCALFGLGMIIFGDNKFYPFMELTEQQKIIFGAFGTIKWQKGIKFISSKNYHAQTKKCT